MVRYRDTSEAHIPNKLQITHQNNISSTTKKQQTIHYSSCGGLSTLAFFTGWADVLAVVRYQTFVGQHESADVSNDPFLYFCVIDLVYLQNRGIKVRSGFWFLHHSSGSETKWMWWIQGFFRWIFGLRYYEFERLGKEGEGCASRLYWKVQKRYTSNPDRSSRLTNSRSALLPLFR